MEWSCLELSEHKSCVQAAAGDVVESFYRAHVPDSDMRMNTLIDLLSVVSEDFEWGLGVIGNEPSLNQARESIRKRCNSGESPIDNFLRQQSSESEAVRITSLDTFRSRLVHEDRELCETLPIMYSNLVDLLRTRLEQRLIEGDCTPDNR